MQYYYKITTKISCNIVDKSHLGQSICCEKNFFPWSDYPLACLFHSCPKFVYTFLTHPPHILQKFKDYAKWNTSVSNIYWVLGNFSILLCVTNIFPPKLKYHHILYENFWNRYFYGVVIGNWTKYIFPLDM